jgi:hypothetical protein
MTRSELYASVLGPTRDPIVAFVGGLCAYREARGETAATQFAQACSVCNRVMQPCWWGTDVITVVLKPFQYSSFNFNDPNNLVWPLGVKRPNTNLWGLYQNNLLHTFLKGVMADAMETSGDDAWFSCLNSFNNAARGTLTDPTNGATHYYDKSIGFPGAWGTESDWVNTATIGRLLFWKAV